MDIKITKSKTLVLHKNVLCLLTKHHGMGIQIADERLLDSGNGAYQLGCFKLDRRELDKLMPSVDYIACCRIPFTNKIVWNIKFEDKLQGRQCFMS